MHKKKVVLILKRVREKVIETRFKLWDELKVFDPNSTGKIEDEQLQSILTDSLDCALSDDELNSLFSRYSSYKKMFQIDRFYRELQLEPSPYFQSDPALLFDRLPQPYRMINNMLEDYIISPVFDELRERIAASDSSKDNLGFPHQRKEKIFHIDSLPDCEATKLIGDIPGLSCVTGVENALNSDLTFAGTNSGQLLVFENGRLFYHRGEEGLGYSVQHMYALRRQRDGATFLLVAFQESTPVAEPTEDPAQDETLETEIPTETETNEQFHLKLYLYDASADSRLKLLVISGDALAGFPTQIAISPDCELAGVATNQGKFLVYSIPSIRSENEVFASSSNQMESPSITEALVESHEMPLSATNEEEEDESERLSKFSEQPCLEVNSLSFDETFTCVTATSPGTGSTPPGAPPRLYFVFLPNRTQERFDGSWKISRTSRCVVRTDGSNAFHQYSLDGSNPLFPPLPPQGDAESDLPSDRVQRFPELQGTARPALTWYLHSEITAWCLRDGAPLQQTLAVGAFDGSVVLWAAASGIVRDLPLRVPAAVSALGLPEAGGLLVGSRLGHLAAYALTQEGARLVGRRRDLQAPLAQLAAVPGTPLCVAVFAQTVREGSDASSDPVATAALQTVLVYDFEAPRPVLALRPKVARRTRTSSTASLGPQRSWHFGLRRTASRTAPVEAVEEGEERSEAVQVADASLVPAKICLGSDGDRLLLTCATGGEFDRLLARESPGAKRTEWGGRAEPEWAEPEAGSGVLLFTLRDLVRAGFPALARACKLDASEPSPESEARLGWGKGLGGMASKQSLYATPIARLFSKNEASVAVPVRRMLQLTTADQRADKDADFSLLTADGPLDIPGALPASPSKLTIRSVASLAKSTRSRRTGNSARTLRSNSRFAPSLASQSQLSVGTRSRGGKYSVVSGTPMQVATQPQLLVGPTAIEFHPAQGYVEPKLRLQEFVARRGETRMYRESQIFHRQREWAALALSNSTS